MAPERSTSVLTPKTCFNLKSTSIDFLLLILNNPNFTQRDFASISTHIEYFKIIKKLQPYKYFENDNTDLPLTQLASRSKKRNSHIRNPKFLQKQNQNLLNAGTAYYLLFRHSPTEIKGVVFSIRRACYNWHLTTFNRSHS